MSEPAREFDDPSSGQDELASILAEADAARRRKASGPPDPNAPVGPIPIPAAAMPDEPTEASASAPSDGVKFDRYVIKVPEAGPNKIPTLQVSNKLPWIVVFGVAALAIWSLWPGGIEIYRPDPLPDTFVEASARWTLAMTAERIDHFAQVNGQLPLSLEELDSYVSDIVTYQRLPDERYQLQTPGHRGMVVLKPRVARDRFLLNAPAQLRNGPEGTP